jgi:hypothetical protein
VLNDMSLAMEKTIAPQRANLQPPPGEGRDAALNITVVFTSVRGTSAALRSAAALAMTLGARINLVVLQIVPYPLPLTSPPVLVDFSEGQLRNIASESPVDTTVLLYMCRDRLVTLPAVLKPHSLVILGGRGRWWLNPERSLARTLRRAGHDVIFTETE